MYRTVKNLPWEYHLMSLAQEFDWNTFVLKQNQAKPVFSSLCVFIAGAVWKISLCVLFPLVLFIFVLCHESWTGNFSVGLSMDEVGIYFDFSEPEKVLYLLANKQCFCICVTLQTRKNDEVWLTRELIIFSDSVLE